MSQWWQFRQEDMDLNVICPAASREELVNVSPLTGSRILQSSQQQALQRIETVDVGRESPGITDHLLMKNCAGRHSVLLDRKTVLEC